MTDPIAAALYILIGGVWGAGVTIILTKRYVDRLMRHWQACMHRLARGRKISVLTECNRITPQLFSASVRVNDVYAVRIYAKSDAEIHLRVLDRDGKEMQPMHIEVTGEEAPKGASLN